MSTSTTRGLASVIVPCSNQLEFTRQCIAALKSHTRPPWELIVIDNGSTDHTGIYLAGVRDGAAVPVTVISNPTNRGFPAAINQGLKAARGEYLVLLNNDVVVTDGWLDQLVALANAKRLSTAEHAEHGEIEAEELGAGSGDPRTARHADELGAGSGDAGMAPTAPGVGDEMGSVAVVPPATEIHRASGAVRPTPPGPPFARVGNVLALPSVDSAGAGVEDGETSAAPSSLPTAGCLLPTVRSIGLVGPMSNYAAPPQLVENVPYQDLRAMHGFARRWRDEHRGKWFAVRKLSGFCLLMKRAVYDKIGGLDERFGIGFFDDDDLAERARRAGFELAVARDLFEILPSLKRAKVPVRWTDLTVRHTGYVDRALRARKLDRDMRILERELEERPDEPFVLFNLGAIAVERREWHEALGFLERSLARSAPADSIVRKLYALIARAHQMTGQSQEALRTCAEGLKLDPEDAELWHRKGVVHRHRGESTEAEECWRRILNLKRPDQFCSVDQGIYGHVTRRNLAALAAERGDHAEARRLWAEVLAECPGDREALAKLKRLPGAGP